MFERSSRVDDLREINEVILCLMQIVDLFVGPSFSAFLFSNILSEQLQVNFFYCNSKLVTRQTKIQSRTNKLGAFFWLFSLSSHQPIYDTIIFLNFVFYLGIRFQPVAQSRIRIRLDQQAVALSPRLTRPQGGSYFGYFRIFMLPEAHMFRNKKKKYSSCFKALFQF